VLVKVVRSGGVQEVSTTTVVVGDIVMLEAGDKVPADGVLLKSSDVKVCC
jgi:P-type E1-E2 ATPase